MSYALDTRRARRVRPHSLHGLGCGCGVPVAGLGELTLPETILTPGEIVSSADQINRAVMSLNGDVLAHARLIQCGRSAPATGSCSPTVDGGRFMAEWISFKGEWMTFYIHLRRASDPSMTPSGLLAWVRGQGEYVSGEFAGRLHELANAYNAFEVRFGSLTGISPTQTTHEYVPFMERLSRLGQTGMVWVGIGIVGVVAVGYLLSNYAKIRMMSKLAFNRRRPRRNRRRR